MRALFVGGVLDALVLDVGDPAPAEWRADQPHLVAVPRDRRTLEGVYGRRDFAVELEPGTPSRFVVYLAGPEMVGWAEPSMRDHLARHVLLELSRAGLVALPGRPQG